MKDVIRASQIFTAMADEEVRSRVYRGVDFTFTNTAGQSVGRNVGVEKR
ncbi:MAG: hypothetical protein ACREBG_22645 [Pyrinomonadaceae bacterium]